MEIEKIDNESIYAFSSEAEALFLAYNFINNDELKFKELNIYDEKKFGKWRSKYRYLIETFESIKELTSFEIFDFIIDSMDKDLTILNVKKSIEDIKIEDRLFRLAYWPYEKNITKKDISNALVSDEALEDLYIKVKDRCSNYLGFTAFMRDNNRYIKEFFELANDINTIELHNSMKVYESEFFQFKKELILSLDKLTPMDYSESLMGKKFKNRGPYEHYYFIPSLTLPIKSLRLFYKNGTKHNKQVLFVNILSNRRDNDNSILALKSLSDETRYQILRLLAKSEGLNGQDIKKELKLAPSTISHHMSELKEVGLITEEPVKNYKIYGVSKNKIKKIIEKLESDFLIKK